MIEKSGKGENGNKNIRKKKIKDKDDKIRINREFEMLSKFNHINVILVTEIFESPDRYYCVMEYCEGGELFNYIVKKEDNQQISQRKEREDELNSNNDKMQLESSEKLFEKLSDNIPNITNKENNSKNSLEIKSNENNVSENEKISNENENNKEKSQDKDKNKDPDLVSNEESYEESDENDRESN